MRVCDVVINSVWFDPRVRRQIKAYMAAGVEVKCVGTKCPRFVPEKVAAMPCSVTLVELDPRFAGKQNKIWKKLVRERSLFTRVRDAIIEQKPDIIHANDLNALLPAYAAAKKTKAKLIYDSHEIWVENYVDSRTNLYARIMWHIEKWITHRVDMMIAVSHAAAEYFAQEYDISEPLVITNCTLKSDRVQGQCYEKKDGFEVLNHGQFHEGRGYDVMARACGLIAEYSEIKLVVRGFGRMENCLRETVSKFDNAEQFVFYPKVNVEELIPLATKSHVGVAITEPICLNFKLSVSNKLFEYAAVGLPVIMSDIPEHRYLNEKYDFGIIIPDNTPESFAKAVIQLYTDHELYERLSKNALKMSDEVNWENEFERLLEAERALTAQK